MGTVTVQSIIDRAVVQLQDTTNVRWPPAELVPWVNDGSKEIVLFKPSAYTLNEQFLLTAGTKQRIPAAGVQLLDVVRNLGSSGSTPGRAIRLIEREILDSQIPGWHSMTPAAEVKHFSCAANDVKDFYVYPPSPGSQYVELVYSAAPPTVTLGGTISIDDIYQAALLDYVLYRAYQKDTEYATDPARAQGHYAAFMSAVKGRDMAEKVASPNVDQHSNPNSSRRG